MIADLKPKGMIQNKWCC